MNKPRIAALLASALLAGCASMQSSSTASCELATVPTDAVFGVRQSLIADWKQQPDGTYLVEYDFVLNKAAPVAAAA